MSKLERKHVSLVMSIGGVQYSLERLNVSAQRTIVEMLGIRTR
jgi:hypothetical protein